MTNVYEHYEILHVDSLKVLADGTADKDTIIQLANRVAREDNVPHEKMKVRYTRIETTELPVFMAFSKVIPPAKAE